MKITTFDEGWDYILERGIVGEEALRLIADINGNTVDTLNDVLWSTTGCRDFEQHIEENEG